MFDIYIKWNKIEKNYYFRKKKKGKEEINNIDYKISQLGFCLI